MMSTRASSSTTRIETSFKVLAIFEFDVLEHRPAQQGLRLDINGLYYN